MLFDPDINLSYRGGGGGGHMPPPDFPPPSQNGSSIKLKLSDFKDTPLRHILHVKLVR